MQAIGNRFDVGGVVLDRPFRIQRLGHFLFNSRHIKDFYRFYIDWLGFITIPFLAGVAFLLISVTLGLKLYADSRLARSAS